MAYRGQVKLTPQQMRAAVESLPFENPKLSAVGYGHFEGTNFAAALERVIERSQAPLPLPAPGTVIEYDPDEMKKPIARHDRRWSAAPIPPPVPTPEQMEAHHDRTGLCTGALWLGHDYWWVSPRLNPEPITTS